MLNPNVYKLSNYQRKLLTNYPKVTKIVSQVTEVAGFTAKEVLVYRRAIFLLLALPKEKKEKADLADDATIGSLCYWADTPQGHDFWSAFSTKFHNLGL